MLTETKLEGGELRLRAYEVWRETVRICRQAPQLRIASSLSAIEIFVALYYGGVLRCNPRVPFDPERDRCIVSKGHGSIGLYPILADLGFFTSSELTRAGQIGSFLGAIPDPIVPGYETVNGSLGHGLGVATGMAIGLARRGQSPSVFVVTGDGELQEGANWEAIMLSATQQLDNLHLIVDANGMSMLGPTGCSIGQGNLVQQLQAFGWSVWTQLDGHDPDQLAVTLNSMKAERKGQPKALIAKTIKGRGVPGLEGNPLCHVLSPSLEVFDAILGEEVGA